MPNWEYLLHICHLNGYIHKSYKAVRKDGKDMLIPFDLHYNKVIVGIW